MNRKEVKVFDAYDIDEKDKQLVHLQNILNL